MYQLLLLTLPLNFLFAFGKSSLDIKCEIGGVRWKYGCICKKPWTGYRCHKYICVNGLYTGSHYDPTSLFFQHRCLCDAGWTGESCDSPLADRCNGRGKTVNGMCSCDPFYAGSRCEKVVRCVNGQLHNGRCACHYGWSGCFCDKIQCHKGYPDATKNNESCLCSAKYRGRFCDLCLNKSTTPFPNCDQLSLSVQPPHFSSLAAKFLLVAFFGIVILAVISFVFCVTRCIMRARGIENRFLYYENKENEVLDGV